MKNKKIFIAIAVIFLSALAFLVNCYFDRKSALEVGISNLRLASLLDKRDIVLYPSIIQTSPDRRWIFKIPQHIEKKLRDKCEEKYNDTNETCLVSIYFDKKNRQIYNLVTKNGYSEISTIAVSDSEFLRIYNHKDIVRSK